MAPLLFKDRNFSCASPASTAICTSIDRRSIVQPSSSRALDRHTPHLRDSRRSKSLVNSLAQAPVRTKSYIQRSRRSLDSKHIDVFSPPGSARYLLNDEAFFDVLPDKETANNLSIAEIEQFKATKKDVETDSVKQPPTPKKQDQVVVLRVSLHCKGCEGKVRKHISKMEGVTSFEIDFTTKKVTVVGDITPLGVLNSITKVKNAQFWPSPTHTSPSY